MRISRPVALWALFLACVGCCVALFFTPKYPYLIALTPVVFGLVAFMPVPGGNR